MHSLLPSNTTPLERAVEGVIEQVCAQPVPLRSILDASDCPLDLLPWLAWSWGIDTWDSGWDEGKQRASIQSAYNIHAHKGSLRSVQDALEVAGYAGAVIAESQTIGLYDGSMSYDGENYYGYFSNWAIYKVQVLEPISVDQGAVLRKMLSRIAPARCHLEGIYSLTPLLYNDHIRFDGTYTYGAV